VARLNLRAVLIVTAACAAVAGCGSSSRAPAPAAHTRSPASTGSANTNSTTPDPASSAPRVSAEPVVSGNQLIDARTSRTFIPRGINWSSFEYACTQGWGYSALDLLGTNAAQHEADAISAWHVNTVRLPLNEDCWLGTRGAPASTDSTVRTARGYRDEIRAFVTALNADGIVVILDLQSRKRVGSDDFGNLAMPDPDSLTFWTQVAGAYAADRSVLFDAFNEPYSRYDASGHLVFALTWKCWRDGGCHPPAEDDHSTLTGQTYQAVGMKDIVAAIRATGAKQPILLAGLNYANDLGQWLAYAPADDQLVASFHSYDFTDCSSITCWDSVLAPITAKVPLLASELGANHPLAGYVGNYLAWADAHDVGALAWAWGNDPSDAMALTTSETGPATPYGKLIQTWLKSHPA
jgi:endoglucanase